MIRSVVVVFLSATLVGAEPPSAEQIAALRPYAPMVGGWEGDGQSEQDAGWKAKATGTWGFRETDGRASLDFVAEGKLLKVGKLSWQPADKKFRFACKNPADKKLEFVGVAVDAATIRLDRIDEGVNDQLDRLEIKILRGGDKLMFDFRRKLGRASFQPQASITLFRTGGDEASAEKAAANPPCVVTGGPGRLTVAHGARMVSVADALCKEEFLAHPERYPDKPGEKK